jgi:molybdenum cofactor biosynthesis protein B
MASGAHDSGKAPAQRPFVALNLAILTVSDTRTLDDDRSGAYLVESFVGAGHHVAARAIVRDDAVLVRAQLAAWIADANVDAIVTTGGTGFTARDVTPEALAPLITKPIDGFGELFRWLSYTEIGSSTIQSRAQGALCHHTLVFLLPGSPGACRTGMEKILLPQLDNRTRPCNFVELLPRIKGIVP